MMEIGPVSNLRLLTNWLMAKYLSREHFCDTTPSRRIYISSFFLAYSKILLEIPRPEAYIKIHPIARTDYLNLQQYQKIEKRLCLYEVYGYLKGK